MTRCGALFRDDVTLHTKKQHQDITLWHALATKIVDGKHQTLECKELDVMAIVKEFHAMAGTRGHNKHNPSVDVPKYEYEKHRSTSVKINK